MRKVFYITLLASLLLQEDMPAYSQPRPVQAEGGSVAIGGSVSGSTITVGISPEQLNDLLRITTELSTSQNHQIASLQEKLDLNQRQVRAALNIVGEANVGVEQLPAKLIEVAERFKALQTAASTQPGDDPKVTALKAAAQKAVDVGDLAKADDLLGDIEAIQATALDHLALNAAETSAQRGKVALTRLHYSDAAKHFSTAASRVPYGLDEKRLSYLEEEAEALSLQGDEFGDNAAALSAIERYRQILALNPRDRMPHRWALTQHNLGGALRALGEREIGTARLDQAVHAYRAALEVHTREQMPLYWASIQNNLGNTLAVLGSREVGTTRLEEAVIAFRAALREHTRESEPLQWARTQTNLGTTLNMIGEREGGTARLEEAVATFQAALQEKPRERVPLDWALTQHNLGGALQSLGEREGKTARLEEAVLAYRAALQEHTRERVPHRWAVTQYGLGTALSTLGEWGGKTAPLQEAVVAFRAALQEHTRERMPLYWASIQNNLGNTLRVMGERERKAEILKEAMLALSSALQVFTRDRMPIDWARSTGNQGFILTLLAEWRQDATIAETAVSHIEAAFAMFRDKNYSPIDPFYDVQLRKALALKEQLKRR